MQDSLQSDETRVKMKWPVMLHEKDLAAKANVVGAFNTATC